MRTLAETNGQFLLTLHVQAGSTKGSAIGSSDDSFSLILSLSVSRTYIFLLPLPLFSLLTLFSLCLVSLFSLFSLSSLSFLSFLSLSLFSLISYFL